MKYLKKFEKFDELLHVGDWVFLTNWWAGQHLHYFINTHPAKIVKIKPLRMDSTTYCVEYLYNPLSDGEYNNVWVKDFNVTSGFQNIDEWVTRKASSEEIEKEIMSKDIDKYNL